MVIVLKSMDSNKKLFKKLRAQIVNLLRNLRAGTKNGVSYKKKRVHVFFLISKWILRVRVDFAKQNLNFRVTFA